MSLIDSIYMYAFFIFYLYMIYIFSFLYSIFVLISLYGDIRTYFDFFIVFRINSIAFSYPLRD